MNKIINKFLLSGDKFMPEFHLKHQGLTCSACGQFTEHRERIRETKIQKFRETGNLKHLYRNNLDKACFGHDATYSDSTNVAKRTISDNILKDRAHEIARNRNYDGYQRTASMVSKSFDKKTRSGAIVANKAGASVNKELAEELHKSVVKKS